MRAGRINSQLRNYYPITLIYPLTSQKAQSRCLLVVVSVAAFVVNAHYLKIVEGKSFSHFHTGWA